MTSVITVRGQNRMALCADPGFCYVGRRCAGWQASPWGNPFRIVRHRGLVVDYGVVQRDWFNAEYRAMRDGNAEYSCVEFYRRWLLTSPEHLANLPELRGKTLGCWCGNWSPGQPEIGCHAVVLAKMADATEGAPACPAPQAEGPP